MSPRRVLILCSSRRRFRVLIRGAGGFSRGQALVEFALTFPIFLLVMLTFRGAGLPQSRHVRLAAGR